MQIDIRTSNHSFIAVQPQHQVVRTVLQNLLNDAGLYNPAAFVEINGKANA